MDRTFDYDVFISYRRRDGGTVAHWLRSHLRDYRLPSGLQIKREPIKPYLDTAFERATEDFWGNNIEPALRRSRFLMVVVTPSVFEPRADGQSSWVDREIETFLSLPQGRNVLVVAAAGNPINRLPPMLDAAFPRIDVVDLGGLGTGWNPTKRYALHDRTLPLIARIYNINDTDMPRLRQEEERRKRKRAMQVATGATVLAVVLGALSIFALVQRTRALHGQAAAEAKSLGLEALRDFDSGRQIEALTEAIAGGAKLQELVQSGAGFDTYPTVAPVLALNRVLAGIRERNRREHWEDSVRLQSVGTTSDTSKCRLPEGVLPDSLSVYMGHHGRLLASGCTPNGRYLITTATDGTVRMADLDASGERQLIGLQGAVRFLSFEPDSVHFRTTDVWGTVIDWDLSEASRGHHLTLQGSKSTVTAISFSQDGSVLSTGSQDGGIRVWAARGQLLGEAVLPNRAPVVALWISLNAARVLALDGQGMLHEWVRSSPVPSTLFAAASGAVIYATIRPDGKQGAVALAGGDARLLDLTNGKSTSMRGTHQGWIMGVAIHPRGEVVATAGADDTVQLHRLSGQPFVPPIRAGQGQVMSVAFSPSDDTLASAGDDGTVKLWSLTGKSIGKLVGHEGKVLDVRFSPDGHLIATLGADGTVRLWLRNGEQISQWRGLAGFLAQEALGGSFGTGGLSFSPDGQHIAVGESAGAVQEYEIQSLSQLLGDACAWLRPYLDGHPDVDPSVKAVCGSSAHK